MGVKLSLLQAEFVRRTGGGSYRRVETIGEANGVRFACPLCYLANGGLVGTHGILCWDPSVPLDISPGPGRWRLTGSGLSDLTLVAGSSSVKLEGGCRWHGHVTNGECVGDLDAARVAETQRYWQEQRRKVAPQSETPKMNTAAADSPAAEGPAAKEPAAASPEPAQPSAETHTPTNIFRWINGELHQAFEAIHPGGGPPKMVKVPGTATAPGLLHEVEQLVEAKVKELAPAAVADLAAVKAAVLNDIAPRIQAGVAEAMAAFEARLQALEHPTPAPSPPPPPPAS